MYLPSMKHSLPLLAALVLAACSSTNTLPAGKTPADNIETADLSASVPTRPAEPERKTLADYGGYPSALDAVKQKNDAAVAAYLENAGDSAMAENVRNEWLKSLGARRQWTLFAQEYAKLEPAGRAQEVECYADSSRNDYTRAAELVKNTGKLPSGCTKLLEQAAASGLLDGNDAWRRVRGLLAGRQTTDARNLAAALGSPFDGGTQGSREYALLNVIGKEARKSPNAAALLSEMESGLSLEQRSFAWGVLGHYQSQNLNVPAALDYYGKVADRRQLTDDQIEWYARAALRARRWDELASVISHMPEKLQKSPTWLYWLARSRAATGNTQEAEKLYKQAAATGRNFYAVLAGEELGRKIDTRNNVPDADANSVLRMAEDGAIKRALVLFQNSRTAGDAKMRRQAQAEWRFATRGFDEDKLLTAAQTAFDHGFYDMAVNSAERTDRKLNYTLRYISPFKDTVIRHAQNVNVDPAWVYGLIRQESRFVIGAQSRVGAQGLMQVMPATAREIASKIGMDAAQLYTADGNIRMGTWYMADTKRRLQNNEVLATAGYNAGPGRARRWQADTPLEGAVYAETIPFSETRDYVKKVMTNAAYYAALFGAPHIPLKQRMGIVPAR